MKRDCWCWMFACMCVTRVGGQQPLTARSSGRLHGFAPSCFFLAHPLYPQELFSRFGQITRVYVALDRERGTSKGFAFVNFVRREDAARAISKLNGYGYDNLILHVEWAQPREQR